jgi:hypothetical protein
VRRFGGLAHCLAQQRRATVWPEPWQTVAPLRPINKESRSQSRGDFQAGRVRLALLRVIRSCKVAVIVYCLYFALLFAINYFYLHFYLQLIVST